MSGVRLRNVHHRAPTSLVWGWALVVIFSTATWVRPSRATPVESEVPGAEASGADESPREPKPPRTDADMDERAQRHWGSGMAYLDEGDFPRALDAFTKAYELSGRPRILLAIAVTHERRGDLQSSIETLDEYLRLSPEAQNAAAISAHRDELRQKHEAELARMKAAAQADVQTPNPERESESGAGPKTTHGPRETGSPALARSSSTLKWTALGVGIAAGVAAGVSGVLSWQKDEELSKGCGATQACTHDDTQPGRTMAWISTASMGVSLVGLGVGLWLALEEPQAPQAGAVSPLDEVTIDLDYSPRGLTSSVTWSF